MDPPRKTYRRHGLRASRTAGKVSSGNHSPVRDGGVEFELVLHLIQSLSQVFVVCNNDLKI